MAPTTLVGQKSTTSPWGRRAANEGLTLHMSELLATLAAPVYIERVALSDNKNIMKARRAVRKALELQRQGAGFSFVEILSPCPTIWGKDPVKARNWVAEKMIPNFPLNVFRDQKIEIPSSTVLCKKQSPNYSVRNPGAPDALVGKMQKNPGAPDAPVPRKPRRFPPPRASLIISATSASKSPVLEDKVSSCSVNSLRKWACAKALSSAGYRRMAPKCARAARTVMSAFLKTASDLQSCRACKCSSQ
jgi:hypothetical protein